MEQHRPIDILPDRKAKTLTRWLQDHLEVEIICRDRASCYAEGASQGAPEALQVADRWHLLKNLGEALQRMLEKQNAALRTAAHRLVRQQQEQKYQEMPADLVLLISVKVTILKKPKDSIRIVNRKKFRRLLTHHYV